MLDQDPSAGHEELQFDRAITESTPAALPSQLAVTCAACQASIETEYFDINGVSVCGSCRTAAESAADTPQGMVPLMMAGAYGLGAGIIGAIIYYAVIAITNFEIGIVAILIGYMVGYAVRAGARGRGGRRFQVLAVALTYASIALAYSPLAFKQMIDADRKATTTSRGSGATAATESERAVTTRPSGAALLFGFAFLAALIAALPVLVVFGSFPSGLISAFIIFIGMQRAWRMTGAPVLQIFGPYRVGAAAAPTPA